MRWDLHGLVIEGETNDDALRERWRLSFASRPAAAHSTDSAPRVRVRLDVAPQVPRPPAGEPQFRSGDLLAYYLDGPRVVAHFPRFGQLQLDLLQRTTQGHLVRTALHKPGVFEDLVAIGLSPHLRRLGLFLIHAFAAVHGQRAVLLVGEIGAGKTTTGLALLDAGWQLLSNDSPIVNAAGEILSYPGLLAAFPETFARFAAVAGVAPDPNAEPGHKLTVPAERLWPGVWCDRAPAAAICFPQIEPRSEHALEPLAAPEALRRLLPHAVEQWDRELIPAHLRLLRGLAESTPAFLLRLGPDVSTIPALLAGALRGQS